MFSCLWRKRCHQGFLTVGTARLGSDAACFAFPSVEEISADNTGSDSSSTVVAAAAAVNQLSTGCDYQNLKLQALYYQRYRLQH